MGDSGRNFLEKVYLVLGRARKKTWRILPMGKEVTLERLRFCVPRKLWMAGYKSLPSMLFGPSPPTLQHWCLAHRCENHVKAKLSRRVEGIERVWKRALYRRQLLNVLRQVYFGLQSCRQWLHKKNKRQRKASELLLA